MSRIETIADLIREWPSTEIFGDDLGLKRRGDHVRVMKVRGRIPRHHWPKIIESASRRGLPITQETLERVHTRSTEHAA